MTRRALVLLVAAIIAVCQSISMPADVLAASATDGSAPACTSRPAFKVVIVVGPVGSSTSRYIGWADEVAAAASQAGMAVCRVYTPNADAATVAEAARGAHVFVALMHGNGTPKPNRTLQDGSAVGDDGDDRRSNGLGLNAAHGSSALRYHGATWVRNKLRLAPDAIVILSHMCYTAGNSEDFDRIPGLSMAVRHVDNFAQGFLGSTSEPGGGRPSVVMGLQSQAFDPRDPAGHLFSTLMTADATLDEVFMTTYSRNTGKGWRGSYLPNFGAVGTSDLYVEGRLDGSPLRSPGRIHLDPDLATKVRKAPIGWDPLNPDLAWLDWFAGKTKKIQNPGGYGQVRFGYVRSITGRLDFKAAGWRLVASGGS